MFLVELAEKYTYMEFFDNKGYSTATSLQPPPVYYAIKLNYASTNVIHIYAKFLQRSCRGHKQPYPIDFIIQFY